MVHLSYLDTLEVIKESSIPQSAKNEMMRAVNYLQEYDNTSLGWGFSVEVCSYCGHKSISIHPIPMHYPCECNKCGRMTCYEDDTYENEMKERI